MLRAARQRCTMQHTARAGHERTGITTTTALVAAHLMCSVALPLLATS
jgi:hypothetical protein